MEAALLGLDLDSEGGQRAAISYVLGQGECMLAMRILLHPKPQTSDSAASRTPTCPKLEQHRMKQIMGNKNDDLVGSASRGMGGGGTDW